MSDVTATSRVLALLTHALRKTSDVRRQPGALACFTPAETAEAELLRRTRGIERLLLPLMGFPPLRALALAWVDRRVPDTSRHLLWRKLWFYRYASRFLADSGQVLCLGSGLDALGFRLARQFPDSQIVEVDRLGVVELKREWAAATHAGVRNLRFVAADIGDAGFDPRGLGLRRDRRTLVLAEGLVMYLQKSEVEDLCSRLLGWFTDSLELAFSCLDGDRLRDRRSPIARLDMALRQRPHGEQFRWAMKPDRAASWLAGMGLTSRRIETSAACGNTSYGEFIATASHQPVRANIIPVCPATRPGDSRSALLSS